MEQKEEAVSRGITKINNTNLDTISDPYHKIKYKYICSNGQCYSKSNGSCSNSRSSSSNNISRSIYLGRNSMMYIILLITTLSQGVFGVKILEVEVPHKAKLHSDVQLDCRFDLEGAELYSLTWWRGPDQFYQYSPSQKNRNTVMHNSSGIFVDAVGSKGTEVHLMNLSKASSGKYKCEVLADYPSFEKASQYATMDVIEVPSGPPVVVSSRRPAMYSPGEILRLNCTSPWAEDLVLIWYINGKKIQPQPSTQPYKQLQKYNATREKYTNKKSTDLLSVLQMQLKFSHFKDGNVRITCTAVVQELYSKPTEFYIRRFALRTVAPSLKLYGSAVSLTNNFGSTRAILLLITMHWVYY